MKKNIMFFLLNMILIVQANIPLFNKMDPFSTHQPILYSLALQTEGPIIEFGCGYGSTDLLHDICKKKNRLLISLDDNLEWIDIFRKKYLNDGYNSDNSGWHQFYFVPGKKHSGDDDPGHWLKFLQEFTLLKIITFEICFVDQHPWLGRYETVKYLKDKAKYIVLHDCDYFPLYKIFGKEILATDRKNQIPGIYDFSDSFKYFKVFFPINPWPGETGPPTLVGSNFDYKLINLLKMQ